MTICFNKKDLLEEQAIEEFAGVYKKCGYSVLYTSAEKEEGIRELHELLDGRTTAVAGPSGVGKSSLVNRLQPNVPGFSTLYIPGFEKEDLQNFYPEFKEYEPYCRFKGCSHISEPDCGVKEALAEGKISPLRYENYKLLYEELKDVKKY